MLINIIARFDEDILWIEKFKDIEFIIYNKGDKSYKVNDFKNIPLDNVGREAHTYLSYIIDNYSNLPNEVVFTQGKVSDHITYHQLNRLYSEKKYNTFFKHYYVPDFRVSHWAGEIRPNKENISMGQWAIKYIDPFIEDFILNDGYFVSYGAIFKIDKYHILSRSKQFYEKLRNMLDHINPEEGHFLERLWYYVFNYHKKNILNNPDFIVVGSGLSGSVISEQLSKIGHNNKVLIIEKRDHIGGNCFDYIDKETNIRVSKYGAHIFHTNSEIVWSYINKFSNWNSYVHKVYGKHNDNLFPIPVNIKTVNTLCGTDISTEQEMRMYLDTVRDKTIKKPKNGEEYFLSKIGRELYEKVIKEYTKKQWNKYPDEIDISVLKRIKIQYDFSEGYFSDKYQALPEQGYTKFIEKIVSSKNIQVLYATDFINYRLKNTKIVNNCKHIYYSGPIDRYFSQSGFQPLEYRSLEFDFKRIRNVEYFQGNSVVNYTSCKEKYTRIVEYKHFYKDTSKDTIISKEYSTSLGEPYYPVPTTKNINLFQKYKLLSLQEKDMTFLGRLGSYKYYNMDEAILSALKIFNEHKSNYE